MEQTNLEKDWRVDITEPTATLKIKDGEAVVGVFANEGIKKTHPDFGNSVAFQFIQDGTKEPKTFYVKSNNFDLLGQIKVLGILTGLKVRISRIGSTRSNTRYRILKI